MLSIKKLRDILLSNNITIKKIFCIGDIVIYLELLHIDSSNVFMLYIQSKYEIKVKNEWADINIYQIKYIDIEADDYIQEENNIEEEYDEIDLELSPERKKNNLEKILNDNYNVELNLANNLLEEKKIVKNIYMQLSRLKFCVQNLNYKIVIVYKKYILCIKRDNSLESYTISEVNEMNENITEEIKMYISIDLENFYSKIKSVSFDIAQLKENIFKLLNKNQIKHEKILNDLYEQKNTILSISTNVCRKKVELDNCIDQLQVLLNNLIIKEKDILKNHLEFKNKEKYENKNLNFDIERSHIENNYYKSLENIINTKEEILNEIIKLKIYKEHLILNIDRILFDNSVMLNNINNNLIKLSKI